MRTKLFPITAELVVKRTTEDTLLLIVSGSWKLHQPRPSINQVLPDIESTPVLKKIVFDAKELVDWDSGFLIFLKQLRKLCQKHDIQIDSSELPQGARRLLTLAAAVPEKKDAKKAVEKQSFLEIVGNESIALIQSIGEMLEFIGAASFSIVRFFQRKALFRHSDFLSTMESCGVQALPIISLICFLVGLILAFIGAIQLKLFGAQLYVADLVGIAMVRLMGAIMTGIVMAGRTGGAFAAQIGTMQVNQEIDALRTMGISPMDFLVLPRMLALALMMPLLCLYANVMGILGGMVVGVTMLDLGFLQYYNETVNAVRLWDLGIGIFSGIVFGVIVALSGCMRGMECGRSASAVGDSSTSAVVTAIVGIIITTAIITIVCNILGI